MGGVGAGAVVLAAAAGFVVGAWSAGLLDPRTRPRPMLLGVVVAALFAVVVARLGLVWSLPAVGYLAALAAVLTVVDLRDRRLPDRLVLPSYPISIVLLGVAAGATHDWADAARAAAGMVVLLAGYGMLVLLRPGAMGGGDVKVAGLLGLYLGFAGWGVLLLGTLLPFYGAALAGVGLLLTGRGSRRSVLPFGPFLLAGALTAILIHGSPT